MSSLFDKSKENVKVTTVENEPSTPYLDEIDTLNRDIKISKNEIFKIQNNTIKEMFYSGFKIPSIWTKKQDFRTVISKVLTNDEKFLNFVSTYETEKKQPKQTIKNPTKLISNENDNNYQTQTSGTVEKLRPESHYSHHTRSKSVKSAAILSNSRPITSNTRNIHTPGILRKSRDFNADLSKQTDSFPILGGDKIKRNIYTASVGLKNRDNKLDNIDNNDNAKYNKTTNNIVQARKIVHKKQQSEGAAQFLHAVEVKEVEVKNKQIKKLLNECDNRGPFYSHCKSCNNRNLEFITKIKVDQATKILNYIKVDHDKEKFRLFKI